MTKPELLAPAGDFERLRAAVSFGADAVYLGATNFSLRQRAKNFESDELQRAVDYAHGNGVKVYVTANIFAHNPDLAGAAEFFAGLLRIGADAVLISDPGFFDICREAAPGLEIHISTQLNTTNYRSAAFWHKQGAKRIVLARELSISEIAEIRANTPESLGLECFVHGAVCVSYSGRCLLSNYLTGRDSNRGECAHPCRYSYTLQEETRPGEFYPVYEDERGTYILNSSDICMAAHLPELLQSGVESLKIEGRMKTAYYVASVVKVYREAIDDLCADSEKYRAKIPEYIAELSKASHRPYGTGFYFGKPGAEAQIYGESSYIREWDFCGLVLDYNPETQTALIEQRNKFSDGQTVEFLRAGAPNFSQTISRMTNADGSPVTEAPHAQQKVFVTTVQPLKPGDIMRAPVR